MSQGQPATSMLSASPLAAVQHACPACCFLAFKIPKSEGMPGFYQDCKKTTQVIGWTKLLSISWWPSPPESRQQEGPQRSSQVMQSSSFSVFFAFAITIFFIVSACAKQSSTQACYKSSNKAPSQRKEGGWHPERAMRQVGSEGAPKATQEQIRCPQRGGDMVPSQDTSPSWLF